jgi:hypothetical protein
MRYTLSDKLIAYLTLISGLVISAVAVWYSVAGLVAIFAASAFSIIIMGVALETSKLIATIWLKWNWSRAPRLIKIYLISAIAVLMLITSMGIFGYLSKAHLDQNLVSGGVQAQISLIDEKIKIERENIANAQAVIKQMDAAVTGVIATGDQEVKLRDGSTRVNSAAERSLQIRRSQAKDRAALTKQIEESQTRIVTLQEEAAPIRSEMRAVEAKVGPIKYIAALIYGDNPDANVLEKAVTWVIIIIVLVFDPLAVVLLLASQYSFQWFRQQEEEERKDELDQENPTTNDPEDNPGTQHPDSGTVIEADRRDRSDNQAVAENDPADEANEKIAGIEREVDVDAVLASVEQIQQEEKSALDSWNSMIEEAEKAALEESINEDKAIIDSAEDREKTAMRLWKAAYPDDNLKHQRKLFDTGIISELPWMVPPYMVNEVTADNTNETVDTEISGSGLKLSDLKKKSATYIEKIGKNQVVKPINDQ